MSPLLIALLGVLVLPLFIGSWRASLIGLSLQGFLMALIAYGTGHAPSSAGDFITLFDLVLVRGLGAPLLLRAVLRAQSAELGNDVIPPNLLSWTFALAILLMSFSFAQQLIAQPGDQQTLLAVATAALLLGFLVLATRSAPLPQIVGALRIENAIALFELGGERHHANVGVQLAQVAVVMITVGFYRYYLTHLRKSSAPADAHPEWPTL